MTLFLPIATQLCTIAAQFFSYCCTARSAVIAIAIVTQSAFAVRPQLRRNLEMIENTSFLMLASIYISTVWNGMVLRGILFSNAL